MNRLHTFLAITVLALLPAASLGAQGESSAPQQPKTAPPAGDTTTSNQKGEGDAILAAWLLMASNNEVALAGLAQQKASSSEVKQFAQMMVGDHGRFAQKLQAFATAASSGRSTGNTGRANDRDGTGRQQQPADASGNRQGPMGFDHMALIRDLGKKCLEVETNLLNEKNGADFDRCYIGMQIVGHTKAAGMIEVFSTQATDQLRPILEEGHKTVLAHLEQAKTLSKQLEKGTKVEPTEKTEKTGTGK